MNIFDKFLIEIKILVKKNKNSLKINELNDFKNIVVENPPIEFDYHLSTNICLILGKLNQINPKILAEEVKNLLLKETIYQKKTNGPKYYVHPHPHYLHNQNFQYLFQFDLEESFDTLN